MDLHGIAGDLHLPSLDFDGAAPLRSAGPVLGTIADVLPAVTIAIAVLVALAVLRTMRVAVPNASTGGRDWPVASRALPRGIA